MDILYVIGKQSAVRNELRYSLRTIENNCQNVGRIYIVGYCPDYVDTEKVTFIEQEDVMLGYKHNNILNAIKQAILRSDIGEEFLLSSDDHFYMNKADFDHYPYYCKGELEPILEDGVLLSYNTSLVATKEFLEKNGLPTYNFSWHGNTHFNKRKFIEMLPLIDRAMMIPSGIEPTCLMLNAMLADERYKFEFVNRKDNKTVTVKDWNSLVQLAKDKDCISFSDEAWEGGCAKEFRLHYNKKSKWEI